MFNLLNRPWTEDPEFSVTGCETGLRVVAGAFRTTEDLPDWAASFAALSQERAEAWHATVRDYLHATGGTAQDARAESSQLDRDAKIAHDVGQSSRSNSARVDAHTLSLCAAHLANTNVLKLALLKTPEGHADRPKLAALYEASVQLSDWLVELAAAAPEVQRDRAVALQGRIGAMMDDLLGQP